MPTGPRSNLAMRPLYVCLALAIALSALAFAPPAQATDGVEKELTFLLHSVNATETAKPIPGSGSTLTYFDTTLEFNDVNVSILVQGTQKTLQWFLSPPLAGDFRADGFTLRLWANSSTAASSNAQVTLGIYEVSASGVTQVHETGLGGQVFTVTPQLRSWSFPFAGGTYTFAAESSIELRIDVNTGIGQGVWFHYDTAQFNSRVSFTSSDSIDVAAIATRDVAGTVRTNFDPDAADKTIRIQAHVTDPIGAYDVRRVNLTLTGPDGVVLDNVSMTRLGGTPIDFESVYEYVWDYTGQPTGPYDILVWALDNNGHNHYHFFQQFTYADYPDVGTARFFIGGLPAYVNVLVVDSVDAVLAGARVVLVSAGFAIDEKIADAAGRANLSMARGEYEFRAFWQGIQVGSVTQDVQDNVSAENPLVIATQVFYPTFRALDAEGAPLAGASLLISHPNGGRLGPLKTNATGQVSLSQVPVGTYGIAASWRGIDVFAGDRQVSGNGVVVFTTAVYHLTVRAVSAAGTPLAGVFVRVADETGLVFDAGVTAADGTVLLRLPAGTYTVSARLVTEQLGTLYDSGERTDQVSMEGSTSTTLTFGDFPLPLTSTVGFLFALLYGLTIAGFIALMYILRRRTAGGPKEGPQEQAKGGELK